MGAFRQTIGVGRSLQGPFIEVEALVDTGATYTSLPDALLELAGVVPIYEREFEVADGRVIRRKMGEAAVKLNDEVHYTVVVFAGERGRPLLGVVTLETFGLAVDPVRQRLVPMRGLLL